MRSERRGEELAGRAHLGRAARPPGDGRGLEARPGTHLPERHHRDAQLRRRADAVWAAVSRRRRGAHRAADRREGLDLGPADVRGFFKGFARLYSGQGAMVKSYSATALRRVWRAEHFSWWMTSMLHRFHDETPFHHRLQLAELDYVVTSRAKAQTLAENYVGLPLD